MAPEFTREKLIELAQLAIVPVSKWSNRDTSHMQQKLGVCLALLKAGCDYSAKTENLDIIDVTIFVPGFRYFESGYYGQSEDNHDDLRDIESFSVPTPELLAIADGSDWYHCHVPTP